MLRRTLTFLVLALSLVGCGTTGTTGTTGSIPQSAGGLYDRKIVRMYVNLPESPNFKTQVLEAHKHNWGPNAQQYRWAGVFAAIPDNIGSKWLHFAARVPDQLPTLKTGDLVEVATNNLEQTDYNRLQAPVIVRVVCAATDKACIKRTLHGKMTDIVLRDQDEADTSGQSFTIKYPKS